MLNDVDRHEPDQVDGRRVGRRELVTANASPAQIVSSLYLSTLSRPPSPPSSRRASRSSRTRRTGRRRPRSPRTSSSRSSTSSTSSSTTEAAMKTLLPSSPGSGATPVNGPDLSRRGFLELGATGLVASWFLKSPGGGLGRRVRAGDDAEHREERHLRLPARRAEPGGHVGPQGGRLDARGLRARGLRRRPALPGRPHAEPREPPRRRRDRALDEVAGARPRPRPDVAPDRAQPDGRDRLGGAEHRGGRGARAREPARTERRPPGVPLAQHPGRPLGRGLLPVHVRAVRRPADDDGPPEPHAPGRRGAPRRRAGTTSRSSTPRSGAASPSARTPRTP